MNSLVEKVIESVSSDVFSDTTVRHLIKGTDHRRYGLVKRAIESGEILHLRRGLYMLANKYQRGPCNLHEIAQKIYGPSYVSLESALAYHGWIPEAVYAVTSASIKRSIRIETPLGVFNYNRIPSNKFFVGVQRITSGKSVFLMASPWRALADYVYVYKKKWRSLKPLVESLRIDESHFKNVDFQLLDELYQSTRSVNVKQFIHGIKKEMLR